MAEHPNAALVRKGYEAFGKGDVAALTQLLAEGVVWHLPGNSHISGQHKGRDAVFAVFAKMGQISGGTFKIDIHDVIANDEHTVVVQRVTGSRPGKQLDARNVDVYHIRGGKASEWWSFTDEPHQEDEFWS